MATTASSLINVCQKPGSGLRGVKAVRNNGSHHQQEWQKRRNEKESEVGQGEEVAGEVDDRGEARGSKEESNFGEQME